MTTADLDKSDRDSDRRRQLVVTLHQLPIGWAAILLVVAATVWAIAASLTGFDYAAAAFIVVAVMVGAIFGVSAWDLAVTLFARRYGEHLTLPYTVRPNIPPRVVPFLTPVAFVVGILIGHWYWN